MLTEVKKGTLFLCIQLENGDIAQVGTTVEQSKLLQAFCAALSQDSKLVILKDPNYLLVKKGQ